MLCCYFGGGLFGCFFFFELLRFEKAECNHMSEK